MGRISAPRSQPLSSGISASGANASSAHASSAGASAPSCGKITVAQIIRQAGAVAAASSPPSQTPASPPGGGTAAAKSAGSSVAARAAYRRAAQRRRALAGGNSNERSSLAAELGTVAPIGPAVVKLLALAKKADVPPLLIGSHGLGKSEITATAAAELGIDCISRDLSLMEPPDLVGLPKIDGGATTFLPPEFLPRETGRGGFLLIEEINRAPRYMQACCLELLTSRRLGSYHLPRGWVPVACINPRAEGYAVDLLDAALMSRFMQITVTASVDSWVSWARANQVHPKVIEYVETVPNSLDESQGGSNPRSWTYASKTLNAAGAEFLEESPDTIVTALTGLIGPVHTTALLRLIMGTEMPLKPADILQDWAMSRATMNRWKKQGRLDLLKASMRAVLQWVRPEGVAEELSENVRGRCQVRGFFEALPGDLADQARGCLLELGYTFLIPGHLDSRKN
jgi:hypothetical protein